MNLFLLRHTRPLPEVSGCYGRLDVPVDPLQAACRADTLRPVLPEGIAVWSSPAGRCRVLAGHFGQPVRLDERLREMDFGVWEGQPWDAIPRAGLDAWAAAVADFVPPGGESARAVQRRALDFVGTLTSDALLVTHAGVIRTLLAHWQETPAAQWLAIRPDFGQLTQVVLDARRQCVCVTPLPV